MHFGDVNVFFTFDVKGTWHETFEKLILLKLAYVVSFHLNISSTMKLTANLYLV